MEKADFEIRMDLETLMNGGIIKKPLHEEIACIYEDSISYFDYAENYYHGFLSGLFAGFEDYEVLSNRESGTGRPDLILKPEG